MSIFPENTTHQNFNGIYKEHSSRIYNLAFRMTGDKMLAEDITQETFIRVYQKYSEFRGESSLYTWIYSIARNICFQHHNKTKQAKFQSFENLITEAEGYNTGIEFPDPEKRFYISQIKEGCLSGLLRCLSFYQRITFILVILYDISTEDTARITGKSANSVRILAHRARHNMKKFLCKNCSLYDQGNKCKCENLISFSLDRKWIQKKNKYPKTEDILSELKAFRDETELLRTIKEFKAPEEITKKISIYIKERNFQIFSNRKALN